MDYAPSPRCNLKQTCDPAGDPLSAWLADKYNRRVPLYTSYPTALSFRPEIGPHEYRQWLAALPKHRVLSLYLHIPYCEYQCRCYLDSLLKEMDLVAEAMPHRPVLSAVHLGGSPNILSPSDLLRLFTHLRKKFVFADMATIAAE